MVPHSKSPAQVVYYLQLLSTLLLDLRQKYPADEKSLIRDDQTLRCRVFHEGIEFMTKTLPKLGKAFDRALETGFLEVPREFKRSHADRTIPAFMQGMFRKCFSCGRIQDQILPDVIKDIRQVCYLVYKLELPFGGDESSRVIERFISTEQELSELSLQKSDNITLAARIIRLVLKGQNLRNVSPRHGPGAVATGERLEEKWVFSRLYEDIHQMFPYYDYFMIGSRASLLDRVGWYRQLTRLRSGTAKVVLVPKDSRGPRLISCEPLEYQWIQQGVNRVLVSHLESHWLTGGQINFHDQSINASLACLASRFGYYATIDLKDASDRVSLQLINHLFDEEIVKVLMAVRSTATQLPDGSVLSLAKFAPMGSAVCFSIEALCFWALCVAAICQGAWHEHSKRASCPSEDLWSFCSKRDFEVLRQSALDVFVYGDDIVIPCDAYDRVVEALEGAGLRVNTDKCYRSGDFRESCGVDAYRGINVTPTKISTLWSGSRGDGTAYASYTSYANDFARKGYSCVASFMRNHLRAVYGRLPFGLRESGYPCIEVPTYLEAIELNTLEGIRWRWNRDLQRVEFKVKCIRSGTLNSELDSWERLLRDMTMSPGDQPNLVTVPRRTKIAWKWTVP